MVSGNTDSPHIWVQVYYNFKLYQNAKQLVKFSQSKTAFGSAITWEIVGVGKNLVDYFGAKIKGKINLNKNGWWGD